MIYRIKNWQKHQHFKDRRPPWVKLYRDLLDDPDWHDLNPEDAKLLIGLWLVASEDQDMNGALPEVKRLAFRLRTSEKQLKQSLTRLSNWLIQDDIGVISERYQVDAPEAEAEAEAESTLSGKPDPAPKKQKKNFNVEATEVLAYLNQVCGTSFQPVQASMGLIASRLREGATVEEMRGVVDRKHKDWGTDDKMRVYLRPKTLFNATNYASYQGASTAQQQKPAAIPFDMAAYEAKRKADADAAKERMRQEHAEFMRAQA